MENMFCGILLDISSVKCELLKKGRKVKTEFWVLHWRTDFLPQP